MGVMDCAVRSVSVGGWAAAVAAYQPVAVASCGIPLHDVEWAPYAATAGSLEHVSVDHGRLHIRVAEQLLDRPDVVAIFEKMRRERVPQAVTDRVLVDAHLPHRLLHCSLYGRLIQMMPSLDPAPGIDGQPRRREEILPAELACGIRVLSLQRVGQPNQTPASGEILPVNSTHPLDLIMQRLLETVGKHGAAVLRPLPFANDEEPRRKVDVLDPQSQRFEETQTSSIENRGHQSRRALHRRKQRPHFFARQNDRKLP